MKKVPCALFCVLADEYYETIQNNHYFDDIMQPKGIVYPIAMIFQSLRNSIMMISL